MEDPSKRRSPTDCHRIKDQEAYIRQGLNLKFEADTWGRKWAEAKFRLPLDGGQVGSEVAQKAASVMKTLIDRTYPILESEGLGRK
jgi:hypothetical protein